MRNHITIVFLSIVFVSLFSCVPPTDVKLTEVKLNLRDKRQQTLYDFQDKRMSDSLYSFLADEDPSLRYLAAMAFASIQDTLAIDKIAPLLGDEVEDVRIAAAYAIGQTGSGRSEDYLLRAFAAQDTMNTYAATNSAVLEAMGKIGSRTYLNALATISTYRTTDTLLLEGQAYGIYRYALRNIINPKATKKMLDYATDFNYPPSVRMIAANYLVRAKNIAIDSQYITPLDQALSQNKDANIRMALAIALGKAKTDAALNALINQYNVEKDYRVKLSIIRALGNFDYEKVKATVWNAVDDKNIHIANVAADFFLEHGAATEATLYRRKAKDSLNWETQVKLYHAANRNTPPYFGKTIEAINYELRQRFLNSQNPYEKAAIIRALGEFGYNYRFIKEQAFPADEKIVRTAGMEALDKILNMDNFSSYFGVSYFRRMKEITGYIIEAMQNGDEGMIALGAGTLRSKKLDFTATIDSTALATMEMALNKLKLPKQIETYNELLHTIKFFKGEKFTPKKLEYNNPIEWVVFNNIPEKNTATLKTNKGDIEIEFLKNQAPGSVTNFVQLSKKDFFNNKVFHRVVPNFVIQNGSPRNEMYGSLDYSIRSELPYLHYENGGYVGMASAGLDTEGTQFFITHSPTLHLDGKYTIFAKVIKGMNVVHKITTGDAIKDVTLE